MRGVQCKFGRKKKREKSWLLFVFEFFFSFSFFLGRTQQGAHPAIVFINFFFFYFRILQVVYIFFLLSIKYKSEGLKWQLNKYVDNEREEQWKGPIY